MKKKQVGAPYNGERYLTAMESPVEQRRKELPRGDGSWPGFASVYKRISDACDVMGKTMYVALSDEHVNAMAVLGSGHEEQMKYELARLAVRSF